MENGTDRVISPIILAIAEKSVNRGIASGRIKLEDKQKAMEKFYPPTPEEQAEYNRLWKNAATGIF